MSKKCGVVLVLLGAVMLLSALALFIYNRGEDAAAGKMAQDVLSDIKSAISQNVATKNTSANDIDLSENNIGVSSQYDSEDLKEMTVVNVDGNDYVGYLSVSSLDLELPVMSEWNDEKLKIAPCRQFGSTLTNDFVIAAHNYSNHFGRLKDVELGAEVLFTDMDGNVIVYTVVESVVLQPTDVQSVKDSGYDLVLYTCNYSGAARVTLFCNRA